MRTTSEKPAWFVLTQHWLSLLGLALLATALISWLFVLPQQVRGHVDNPYVGIVVFLVLPALFFTGLALVPIGVYLSKRQIRRGLSEEGFDRQTALRVLDEDADYLEALGSGGSTVQLPPGRNTPVQRRIHAANVAATS